ncbi:hypothetical protein VNO77_47727 [Canavalia gladiata]|uniref:Uncharacterized protein n=2 Tax=Phaseoleae TaxID=163735 RepID=A0AAN9JI62_CANGL
MQRRAISLLTRSVDIEVPNDSVDKSSWESSACYPRRTFDPLSESPSTRDSRITMADFRLCSTSRSHSQAGLYHYAHEQNLSLSLPSHTSPLVLRIFTENSISPGPCRRQRGSRYTIRAGRYLCDKEFRYLRTVRVTAAVYRGFHSKLITLLLPTFQHRADRRAPLLPKLRGHFAEFLRHGSLKRPSILYLFTCVGLGYDSRLWQGGTLCSLATPTLTSKQVNYLLKRQSRRATGPGRVRKALMTQARFRGKPAISDLGWPFTPSHKSSPYFATYVGSVLQGLLELSSTCSWLDRSVSEFEHAAFYWEGSNHGNESTGLSPSLARSSNLFTITVHCALSMKGACWFFHHPIHNKSNETWRKRSEHFAAEEFIILERETKLRVCFSSNPNPLSLAATNGVSVDFPSFSY